jgi:hypothetical protein
MTERSRLFDSDLQVLLGTCVDGLKQEIERTLPGLITPNVELRFNSRKFRHWEEKFDLAVLSWYLGDFGYLLREELLDGSKSFPLKQQEILWCLCASKEEMLSYLSTRYHEREYFGNLSKRIKKNAERVHFFQSRPPKAKRKIRRRGYQDKGSCRPQHRWLPTRDLSFNEEQSEHEAELDFRSAIFQSVESYGLLGVRLPETEGRPDGRKEK